jgi:ABC-2 type transport system permease protein
MTIYLHELKRGRLPFLIWTAAISFMIAVSILIYPEMAQDMNEISDMFSNMGDFSAAFGMDEINFGDFLGYFAVECGNVLGLGGAFFAAITGASALSKEEKEHTAEFLLCHPISRKKIISEKLFALITQITLMVAIVLSVSFIATIGIGEAVSKEMVMIYLSFYLLMLEIGAITFGLSAFIGRGGIGIGLGIAVAFYFMNIIANLIEETEFLKYITPYGYTDGGTIIDNCTLEWKYVAVGAIFTVVGIASAYIKYTKKDIL